MSNLAIDESAVMAYMESEESFPIDFDSAWQWAGYSTKQKGLNKLKKHFEESTDFLTGWCKSSTGGRPSVSYYLTNDCFKMFCMMAGTEKGKEIRRYYLECERQLKDNPSQSLSAKIDESSAIAHSITGLLASAHLGRSEAEKQNLLAGTNLTILGMRHPELRGELMEAHKLLAASTPTSSLLLTPTTIGTRLNLSARAINTLLIEMGFQERVPKEQRKKGEPDYYPTATGERYASNTLATGNGGDRATYQHYKWDESIVGAISDFLGSRTQEVA